MTESWGGGVLFDLGAHPVAIALLLAAPARPVAVRAFLEGADDHPVDEHADVSIRFDTGLHGRVITSWRRSEEHTSELQSLMRISYAVFCLKKKTQTKHKDYLLHINKSNDTQNNKIQ